MGTKLSLETFVNKSTKVHGDTYDYSLFDYKNWDTKSIIICKIHGNFLQQPRLHIERKSGCPICGKRKQGITKAIKESEFIVKATQLHGDKYDYSQLGYVNISSPVNIICPIHGIFRIEYAYAHTTNKTGCAKCAQDSGRNTTEDFITKSKSLYGDAFSYELSQYVTVHTQLTIKCAQHGYQVITPADHYRIGCWICKRNRLQDIWLDSLNLPNTRNHRQVRLKINNRLHIVDGFDSTTNTVYLFHGDYWHGNPILYKPTDVNKRIEKSFGELYVQTLEYEDRIRHAGYKLLVMWEYEWLQQNIV
jgi:hypothetical protein